MMALADELAEEPAATPGDVAAKLRLLRYREGELSDGFEFHASAPALDSAIEARAHGGRLSGARVLWRGRGRTTAGPALHLPM